MSPIEMEVAVEAQQEVFNVLNSMHNRLMDKSGRGDEELTAQLQGILSAVVGHFTSLAMDYAAHATDPAEQKQRYDTFNAATNKIFSHTMEVCSQLRWTQRPAAVPENVISFTPTKPGS